MSDKFYHGFLQTHEIYTFLISIYNNIPSYKKYLPEGVFIDGSWTEFQEKKNKSGKFHIIDT